MDDPGFSVEQERAQVPDEVHVYGELTIYRAGEVAQTLLAAVRAHAGNVSLDMSQVTEFDTAGLQIVLMARRVAEASGHCLDVVKPSECVLDVLQLCRVSAESARALS